MGAARSLEIAQSDPDKITATVLLYGTHNVDFDKVKSKILGPYFDNDEWEPVDEVQPMETNMKVAGLDVVDQILGGRLLRTSEQPLYRYDPPAAKFAWKRNLQFLKKNLYITQ